MKHFTELASELEAAFQRSYRSDAAAAFPWSGHTFEAFALRAFAIQFARIPSYRAFCEARGRTPVTVTSWHDVPSVPASAFKHLELAVGPPEIVFETSGTTRGPALKGRHFVPRLSLYRASLLGNFAEHVLADLGRVRFLCLVPPPRSLPSSSLSFMVGSAADAFATEAHWLVDAAGELDEKELRRVMRETSESGEAVLVAGTALALLHAVERLESAPAPPLASGSRIMETGGFKGSERDVSQGELYERAVAATGVRPGRIVNEYGMTELLSQLYVPVLSESAFSAGRHVAPPWLRVRALDPVTLGELPPGEPGLLAFFDLANAGSVCHVLTEDVGTVVEGRVELRGRVAGSESRGCSRAMDELMSAAAATGTP